MNLIELEARIVCTSEQASALMAHVDHVEHDEHGITRLRFDSRADSRDLLQQTRDAIDRIEEAVAAVGVDLGAGLEFAIRTEALVKDGSAWRRRGEIIPPMVFRNA